MKYEDLDVEGRKLVADGYADADFGLIQHGIEKIVKAEISELEAAGKKLQDELNNLKYGAPETR